ncbi:MAG TPA: head GIN domain-containing protein [Sphingomicrobium sp.]|nr:head GIN domain-containing protein [Sphingomicrobium sp.]
MRKSLSLVIAGAAIVTGCSHGDAEGGGPTVSRNYQVGNFQEVELAGHYDVDIHTGAPVSVSATGPENVLNRLRVEVDGNKLTIGPKHSGGWFHFGWTSTRNVHVTVTVPTLSGATLAGSGVINVDKVHGGSFEGSVAGSGQLNVTNVDVQSLKLNISGSGSGKAGSGRAQSAEFDIAGSGSLDAGAVQTQQVKVSIAGSGGVRAHATSTAKVDIMGSGDVDISGGAKCTVSKAGSGNVRCS